MLLAIFLVSLLTVSAVSAADNMTSDVVSVEETTADAISVEKADDVCVDDNQVIFEEKDFGNFTELSDLIENTPEGTTLELDKNYQNDGSFSSDGISITKAITIDGKGHILDANGKSRIFNINVTKVILKNIVFKNGHYEGNGGAVIFNNDISDCIISNCNFIANNASADGGSLYFKAVTNVTIENATFDYNYADGNGGAIYVFSVSDSLTFKNALFTNNIAESGDGGAINFFRNFLNGVFDNVTFMNNTGGNGGAVNVDRSIESNLFNGAMFINNTARLNGGAIYVLSNSNSDAFNNTLFINNSALSKDGGAINIRRNLTYGVFEDCVFEYNHGRNGGAVNVDGYSSNNLFSNTRFFDNVASENGGAMYVLYSSNSDVFNSTSFINNSALSRDAGAINIYLDLTNGVFEDCVFEYNHGRNGGAVNVDGYSSNNLFNNTRFFDNVASGNGGAFYVLHDSNSDVFKDTVFANNEALSEDGGAINFHMILSNAVFDNVTFMNNTGGNGGAVNIDKSTESTLFIGTRFISNTARLNGGAFYVLSNSNSTTFNNTTFTNNSASSKDGGAINIRRNLTNGVFEDCVFEYNHGRNGGAVNVDVYSINNLFINSRFFDNVASSNGGAVHVLYDSNSDAYMDTSFINNSAESDGGAINYNLDVVNGLFDNVTFEDNIAGNGGAINANDDVVNTTIANSKFENNVAASGINNIALNGNGTFELDNVTPKDLGQVHVAYLTILNVTDNVTYGGTVEISVNVTDTLKKPLNGTVSVTINGENHTANVENGSGKIILSCLNAGKYDVDVTYAGSGYFAFSPATFSVLKQNATIAATDKSYVINYGGKYSIIIRDVDGNVLKGKKVTFTLNGKNIGSATTNAEGIATIQLTAKILKSVKTGKKDLVIKFTDSNYNIASKTVKIIINKEKTKVAAKNKKFKKAKKVKKYTITLKNSKGKGIKKVKVTLKVKGKTYTAKTSNNGKAIFKITKLTKKGKYTATVKYNGNAYYNKLTKKVKIIVK